jgi:hypothetical protein
MANNENHQTMRVRKGQTQRLKILAAKRNTTMVQLLDDMMAREEKTMTEELGYKTMPISPTNDGHYSTGISTGDPVELQEWIWEMQAGAEVYILGKDTLPEGVEDIRGLVHNQPDIVMAIVGHDPVGEAVHYWGANKVNDLIDYLYK